MLHRVTRVDQRLGPKRHDDLCAAVWRQEKLGDVADLVEERVPVFGIIVLSSYASVPQVFVLKLEGHRIRRRSLQLHKKRLCGPRGHSERAERRAVDLGDHVWQP